MSWFSALHFTTMANSVDINIVDDILDRYKDLTVLIDENKNHCTACILVGI